MKYLLSTLLLIFFSACSANSNPDVDQDNPTPSNAAEKAAKEKFEDIHEVMEVTDETIDPLFEGDWDGNDEQRKQLAFHAEMLVHGFGWIQTTLKPKNVDADFSEWAKDTQAFMRTLAAAANTDSASVNALFADPRSIGKNYCGRCHDKYRDD